MTFKEALWLTLASMATGLLLGIFTLLQAPFNAMTSLIVIVITISYFRKFERRGLRIGYVVVSMLYFLLFLFMVSVYKYNLTLLPSTV